MRIVAILPGRFHPVHPGHIASFNQLAKLFGMHNTYLALSQKQDPPRSPFKVDDRAKMALCLGVNRANIISVHYPYSAREYVDKLRLDPENTVLVFGVSNKDMSDKPRFTFEDNSGGYMLPYPQDGSNLQPVSKHAYIVTTKTVPFKAGGQITDASKFRREYARADDSKRTSMINDVYGTYGKLLKPIFDSNIRLTESITGYLWKFSSMIHSATPQQRAKLESMLAEAKQFAQRTTTIDYIDES